MKTMKGWDFGIWTLYAYLSLQPKPLQEARVQLIRQWHGIVLSFYIYTHNGGVDRALSSRSSNGKESTNSLHTLATRPNGDPSEPLHLSAAACHIGPTRNFCRRQPHNLLGELPTPLRGRPQRTRGHGQIQDTFQLGWGSPVGGREMRRWIVC